MIDQKMMQEIIAEFTVDKDTLQEIAGAFRYDMEVGLGRRPGVSSLRMLKSYVALPKGDERGEYLALDFGGTNVRVLLIRLLGSGRYEILKKVAKPLRVPGVYDFIGKGTKAADLFDFIAGLVGEAVEGGSGQEYLLGHTFSFPSEQTDINNARLITWTKEFATEGVEGEVVNDLLQQALIRNGIKNVKPVAIINDTVAVLLAAAYQQTGTYIGSIYATGHNTCYYEPFTQENEPGMILNMESGNFFKLIPNSYDIRIEEMSEKPDEQRLEKMISGRYMGELFGLVMQDITGAKQPGAFSSIDLSDILADESGDKTIQIIERHLAQKLSREEAVSVQELARAIAIRSARLVTATYAGILWHLAGSGKLAKQHIAIDGSVYEKMPLIKENVLKAFYDIMGEETESIETVLVNGGSGLGAAVAACMA